MLAPDVAFSIFIEAIDIQYRQSTRIDARGYIAWEAIADFRHIFFFFRLRPMNGGSYRRSRVVLLYLLRARLIEEGFPLARLASGGMSAGRCAGGRYCEPPRQPYGRECYSLLTPSNDSCRAACRRQFLASIEHTGAISRHSPPILLRA